MKAFVQAALAIGAFLSVGGCAVHEVVVARPAPHCRNAVWVSAGYGWHGRWHPGHWRCARRVVVVE